MSMDWQAFDDNSLSEEERSQAVDRLKNDDKAHRELEGLKSFQKTVRQQCLEEQVPHDRLYNMLGRVCGRKRRPSKLLYALPIAAAAAAIAAGAYIWPQKPFPVNFETSPQLTATTTHSPTQAAQWVKTQSGVNVPVISLSSMPSKFEGARCGSCWISYDYLIGDQNYTISIKQSWHAFDHLKQSQVKNGREYYVSANGIGWYCHGGMSYYVTGGTEEGRWQVALSASRETPKIKL